MKRNQAHQCVGKSVDDPTDFFPASEVFLQLSPAQVILPLPAMFGEGFLEYVPVLVEVPSVLISDVLTKMVLEVVKPRGVST